METLFKYSLLISLSTFIVGCIPSNHDSGFHARYAGPLEDVRVFKPSDTEVYEVPVVKSHDDFSVIRGATELDKTSIHWEKNLKRLTLYSVVKIKSKDLTKEVNIALTGKMSDDGTITLINIDTETDSKFRPVDWEVGAKALCLKPNELGYDCSKAVVDIYLRNQGQIYQHQFEYSDDSVEQVAALPELPVSDSNTEIISNSGEILENEVDALGSYEEKITKVEVEKILSLPDKSEKSDPVAPQKEKVPAINPPIKEKRDQVIGATSDGYLSGGVDMLKLQQKLGNIAGFYLLELGRKRYFASTDLSEIILGLGKWIHRWSGKNKMIIGDISAEKGGRIGSHKSHQTGLDMDVGYLFKDPSVRSFQNAVVKGHISPDLLVDQNWELLKAAVSSKKVARIFIHKSVKEVICERAIKNGEIRSQDRGGLAFETLRRMVSDTEHNSHFHVRIKCPADQRRCRQMAEPVNSTGCY